LRSLPSEEFYSANAVPEQELGSEPN